METKITCPLGSDCQKIVGDHIEQCAWYVKLKGKNPQDGTDIEEYRCAMAWQPVLAIEHTSSMHGMSASVQSLRNETIKRQNVALEVINAKSIES